jgi:ribosomal protein L11 methyltransferase
MYLWRRRIDLASLIAEELFALAPALVAITQVHWQRRAVVEVCCRTKAEVREWQRRLGGRAERLAAGWEKKYLAVARLAPLRIGRRLRVVSDAGGGLPNELVIPAAGAFGTGEHATTAMCLRLLEEVSRGRSLGWTMLDVGTGTGILALAARRLGAVAALGLDNDPRAVAHARANARMNKIGAVKFVRQDFLRWKPAARFDFVAANLFSELLIAAVPVFRRSLGTNGRLILSGILRAQADEVIQQFSRCGFALLEIRRRGKWVALLLARKS